MISLIRWNMDGGDLSVPHFIGMHGLQFMIILSSLLFSFGSQLYIPFKKQIALVWVGFVFYLGITSLVTLQALKNESIVFPSLNTIIFFSLWCSSATFAVVMILLNDMADSLKEKYQILGLMKIENKEKVSV